MCVGIVVFFFLRAVPRPRSILASREGFGFWAPGLKLSSRLEVRRFERCPLKEGRREGSEGRGKKREVRKDGMSSFAGLCTTGQGGHGM